MAANYRHNCIHKVSLFDCTVPPRQRQKTFSFLSPPRQCLLLRLVESWSLGCCLSSIGILFMSLYYPSACFYGFMPSESYMSRNTSWFVVITTYQSRTRRQNMRVGLISAKFKAEVQNRSAISFQRLPRSKRLTHEHDRWDLGVADPVASALRHSLELGARTYM
jgi:hypothetical protein